MKPIGDIWHRFLLFDADNSLITEEGKFKKASKAKCKVCEWERTPNPTRMLAHLRTHEEGDNNEGDELTSVPLEVEIRPAKKQATLHSFMDRKFTPEEQYNAEMAQVCKIVISMHFFLQFQAFAIVMSGGSHNQLEQPWYLDFCRALRADFASPAQVW